MAGAMILLGQFVLMRHHLLFDVPGRACGVDSIEHYSHEETILCHPQALVWRDPLSRFPATHQTQAAAA
jgi:hypothetical protein